MRRPERKIPPPYCKDSHMPRSEFGRIALFIDGHNLQATARTLGFDIDYKRLLREFESRGTLLRAFYYTSIVEDQERSSIRPLIDWLGYNGFQVVTKAAVEFIDANGRRKIQASMDIELAIDAMELAAHVDQIVLFSGDGDFRPLIEALQRRGVHVTVVSTISHGRGRPASTGQRLHRRRGTAVENRPRSVRTFHSAEWARAPAARRGFVTGTLKGREHQCHQELNIAPGCWCCQAFLSSGAASHGLPLCS